MWGQESAETALQWNTRIIPTRVGTRHNYHIVFTQVRDHPHACGDKIIVTFFVYSPPGSSPRVWGQVLTIKRQHAPIRIIPTRVGTRCVQRHLYARLQDHPHACGDKISSTSLTRASAGSSPRVWGQV